MENIKIECKSQAQFEGFCNNSVTGRQSLLTGRWRHRIQAKI